MLTATTLPAYVNEMKRAGMKAKVYESSYNALGTDLVQSKVLQVGGKAVADYYKGATLVSATVPATGASPVRPTADRRDVQRHLREEHEDRRHVQARHRRLHEVGHGRAGVHEHADGGAGDVRRRPKLTQQTFVDALRKLPPDPIGGIGGAPVVVFIDKKTTPTDRVRESRHLPVQAADAPRHDLPAAGEHQGPHRLALSVNDPGSRRDDGDPRPTGRRRRSAPRGATQPRPTR